MIPFFLFIIANLEFTEIILHYQFYKLKEEICQQTKMCGERYLDYKKMSGTKKTYYSSNILKEFDKHYTKKS
jgi:hypothetical protein